MSTTASASMTLRPAVSPPSIPPKLRDSCKILNRGSAPWMASSLSIVSSDEPFSTMIASKSYAGSESNMTVSRLASSSTHSLSL